MNTRCDASDLDNLPFDIASLHMAYERGALPRDVMTQVGQRIDAVQDPGIFIDLFEPSHWHTQCDGLGEFDPIAKPLWGIPFVVKDNIDVAGRNTTAGCPAYAYTPAQDASVVAKLRAAGAIVIGKTNLDQFATGLVGTRSPYPVPRNAIDPTLVPGGSSSGSAVSVAHGIVSFALGTDTAGSGRVPAALNNIVGLKPTLGLISARGVVPACRTLDTVSIFALSVDDAYRVLDQAAGYDERDPYSRDIGIPPAISPLIADLPDIGQPLANLTIGVPDTASRASADDAPQRAMFARCIGQLEAMGATIEPIDFSPFFDVADLLYTGAWIAERYTVIDDLLNSDPNAVHDVSRGLIGAAANLTAAQAFRDRYRLQELQRDCQQQMERLDALCVPSIPGPVTRKQDQADPIGPNNRLGRYTNFVNLLDLCGTAVPVAPRPDGLPGGVTVLATVGRDRSAAAIAAALQASEGVSPGAVDWPLAPRAIPNHEDISIAVAANELAIAAVGAHMSGMPLNHELTQRGARKLCNANSADGYRLYALAGGPPVRPGLVRDDDAGAAIALEVWAMPIHRVGSFLAGIPSPLGLGTVRLANGQEVTGFICESAGLPGAKEVTEFGGWRAFLQSQP